MSIDEETSPATELMRDASNLMFGGICEAEMSSHLLTRASDLLPSELTIRNLVVGFEMLLSTALSMMPFLASQTACSSGKSLPTFVSTVTSSPNLEQISPA